MQTFRIFILIKLICISCIVSYSDIFDREWYEHARCRHPDALCEKCFPNYLSKINPTQSATLPLPNTSTISDNEIIDADDDFFDNEESSQENSSNDFSNYTDGEDICTDKRTFMSKAIRIGLREQAREMFSFAYDNYLTY